MKYIYKVSWTDYSDDPTMFVSGSRDEFLVHATQYNQKEFGKLVSHMAATYSYDDELTARSNAYEQMIYAVIQMKTHLGFEDFASYEAEHEF